MKKNKIMLTVCGSSIRRELKLRQYNNQETEINYNFDTSFNKNINTARL